jgi:hypothetical protein
MAVSVVRGPRDCVHSRGGWRAFFVASELVENFGRVRTGLSVDDRVVEVVSAEWIGAREHESESIDRAEPAQLARSGLFGVDSFLERSPGLRICDVRVPVWLAWIEWHLARVG